MTRTPIFDSHRHELPLGVVTPLPSKSWRLRRWEPSRSLQRYIRWFWLVEWDLEQHGPFEATTLPYPAANLVVDEGAALVHGPTTRLYSRTLSGVGAVIGTLFSPSGFVSFTNVPMREFVDSHRPAQEIFVSTPTELDELVDASNQPDYAIDLVEHILEIHRPTREDTKLAVVNTIVDSIAANRNLLTVDDVAEFHNLSRRTLQRLFTTYVGVGVKTVIRRHRLQEIANLAITSDRVDWATLASELGYSDQAHLIRDFDQTVGTSPARHRKNILTTNRE